MTMNTVKIIIKEQKIYKFKAMDYLFKLHISHKVLIKVLRQSEKRIYGFIRTIIYWVPATRQNLPTLNSLPYFEFNEFAPKSHYYEEEAPQNSGLLMPKSVLFKKK